jgi:hypothetical protein
MEGAAKAALLARRRHTIRMCSFDPRSKGQPAEWSFLSIPGLV